MIYSVFNSNLLLIWRCNLVINKASLILRLRNIASVLLGKLLSLLLHFIKCLWNEDKHALRCSFWCGVVWLYFLYKNYGILSKLNDSVSLWAYIWIRYWAVG